MLIVDEKNSLDGISEKINKIDKQIKVNLEKEKEKVIFLNQIKVEEIEECKENCVCSKCNNSAKQNKFDSSKYNSETDNTKKSIDNNKFPIMDNKNNNSFEIDIENEKKNVCCSELKRKCNIF